MPMARRRDLRPATPAEAPNGAHRESGEAKPAERAPAIEARKKECQRVAASGRWYETPYRASG